MSDAKKLRDAIVRLLPTEVALEVRANIDALVRAQFEKMNLLTREQFTVQEKVLTRTRARVTALEKQVAELERRLGVVAPVGDDDGNAGDGNGNDGNDDD